ncbi:YciI family protein [Mucilaginibacter sp. OK098]|uniref:YciI family protein n=1 Tax=Mucilaginibacter sp. OK098 TaxID=1855297 RepID=UPI0009158E84|nr:YciI family protein [Mucilaginibacter sp. OK098]SHN21476.1 YCII-related domain-containing protein [Mucilaginibacter sp. OK098]
MKSIINIGFFLSGLLLISARVFPQAKTNQSLSQPKKEAKMKNESSAFKEYILLVHLPLNYGPDQAKEVREQWTKLTDKWKANGTYVTSFVYPNDGYLVKGPQKTITKEGIVSDNFRLVSNLVLRATSYEAALELAKNCPVLPQGGIIEVREIQPRITTTESGKELPKPRQ